MNDLISIIVPVYNVEEYVEECICSIVNQTYKNIELILIDDGSTDSSAIICDKWSNMDERIVVLHQENGGLSFARNQGLKIAKGKYIYFVDSDDYIDANLCEIVSDCFKTHNSDIVQFDFRRIDENGNSIEAEKGKGVSVICESKTYDVETGLGFLLSEKMGSHVCTKVFKRHLFDNITFPVGKAFEDVGTTYKLFMNAGNICCIDKKMYNYRRRQNSITVTLTDKAIVDAWLLRQERHNIVANIYPSLCDMDLCSLALAAHSVVVRYWKNKLFDRTIYKDANSFLKKNKNSILQKTENSQLKSYYRFYVFYKFNKIIKGKMKKALWQ